MNLFVNGDGREVADGMLLTALIAEVATSTRGVAVAVNGDIVPRSTWEQTMLEPDDRVEILSAAQGG